MQTNFNIEDFLSLDGYANAVRKKRRKDNNGIKATNEFFTPYSIVKRMCDKIPDDDGCFLFHLCQKIVYF